MRLVGVIKVECDSCQVGSDCLNVDVCEKALEPQHSLESLWTIADGSLETAPELPVA